jgi:hypothetical protein
MILEAALNHCLQFSPTLWPLQYDKDIAFPGTYRPDCEAFRVDGQTKPPRPRHHISAAVSVYTADTEEIDRALIKLIAKFRDEMKAAGFAGPSIGPLPHVNHPGVFYAPVMFDGGFGRVMASYIHSEQAFMINLDAWCAGTASKSDSE